MTGQKKNTEIINNHAKTEHPFEWKRDAFFIGIPYLLGILKSCLKEGGF